MGEATTRFHTAARTRRKVEAPASMTGEPFAHLGMFMGRVVVDDSVNRLSFWNLRLDLVEEADELLMAVTFHVVTDDGAIENVEGGEERRGAIAFVVVRHRGLAGETQGGGAPAYFS